MAGVLTCDGYGVESAGHPCVKAVINSLPPWFDICFRIL